MTQAKLRSTMSLTPTLIFPSCFLPIVHFRPLECAIATLERVFVKLRVKKKPKPYLHIFTEKQTRKVCDGTVIGY